MVMNIANGTFDAPMPGQSLTQPKGASPLEYPPKFVHLDEALNYVWDKLHKPKTLVKLLGMLRAGIPVETLARPIIWQGIQANLWTIDVGLLMLQTVIWQIEAIAKLKKIKAQTYVDDTQHTKSLINIGNIIDSKKVKDNLLLPNEENKPAFKGFF